MRGEAQNEQLKKNRKERVAQTIELLNESYHKLDNVDINEIAKLKEEHRLHKTIEYKP